MEQLSPCRDELVTLCVKGLRETKHPYSTIAYLAAVSLLEMPADGLSDETLREVMQGLRQALTACPAAGPQTRNFDRTLEVLKVLARAEGQRLAPHVHLVVPPLTKRMLSKGNKPGIQEVVRELVSSGGQPVAQILRKRGVVFGP